MSWQSGQALVEWAISVMVLLLFCLGLLAVGQVAGEYLAVRSAASQAALAAARAPSAPAAQAAGKQAAEEAVAGSQIANFQITIDTQGFARGASLSASASGCVGLAAFSLAGGILGDCVPLRWEAHALVEPFRSRENG